MTKIVLNILEKQAEKRASEPPKKTNKSSGWAEKIEKMRLNLSKCLQTMDESTRCAFETGIPKWYERKETFFKTRTA